MTTIGNHFSTLKTAQSDKARGDQKQNNAGGFVFTALRRGSPVL